MDDNRVNFDASGLTAAAYEALNVLRNAQTPEARQTANDHAIAVARHITDSIIGVVGEGWINSSVPSADDGTPHKPASYCVGPRPDLLGGRETVCVYYEGNDDPVPAEVAWTPDSLSDTWPQRDPQSSTAIIYGAESILREVCAEGMLTDIADAIAAQGVRHER